MMELSKLVQTLPPAQLARMQTIMHNSMAGFNVQKEMEEFERSLPPGFREKIMTLFMGASSASPIETTARPVDAGHASLTETTAASSPPPSSADMTEREARLTVLRAVAAGTITPEEAEPLLK